jgi:uncharacterized protein YrrD
MKRKQLIGLPVVDKTTGRILGRVSEVWYEPGNKRLSGLFFSGTGLLGRQQCVSLSDILVLGEHSVIVRHDTPTKAGRMASVIHARVCAQDGSFWGRVGDIVIEPATGAVRAMLVERSLTDDLLHGCMRLDNLSSVTWNDGKVVIVSEDAVASVSNMERM